MLYTLCSDKWSIWSINALARLRLSKMKIRQVIFQRHVRLLKNFVKKCRVWRMSWKWAQQHHRQVVIKTYTENGVKWDRRQAGADIFPAQTVDSCSQSVAVISGDYSEGHAFLFWSPVELITFTETSVTRHQRWLRGRMWNTWCFFFHKNR